VPQRDGNGQTTTKGGRTQRARAANPSTQTGAASGPDQQRQSSQGQGGAFDQLGRIVSENPLPMALIWLGAGWLAMKQLSGRQAGRGSQPMAGIQEGIGAAGRSVEQATTATQDAVSRLLGGAQHFVATIGEQAPRTAEQVVGTAGTQAARVQSAAGRLVEQRPIAMAAAAAAGGAALGLIAPTSRTEAETFASPTKELVERAETMASQTIDTIEQAVSGSSKSRSKASAKGKGPSSAGA
jgi:hypothetical protein